MGEIFLLRCLRHYRTLTSFLLVISKPSPLAARLFSSPHLAAVFWSAVLLAYAKMGMPLLGGRRIRSSGVGSWSPNHCKVAEREKKEKWWAEDVQPRVSSIPPLPTK